MLRLLFTFLFFLTANYGKNLDTPELIEAREQEEIQNLKRFEEVSKIYRKVEGKGLIEITEFCPKHERRIFLFEYPSDGMLIKGYISFVPSAGKQPLLVFLRGGTRDFGLHSPYSKYSFFGNYTVIATTYRDGINPGRDEYGGALAYVLKTRELPATQ